MLPREFFRFCIAYFLAERVAAWRMRLGAKRYGKNWEGMSRFFTLNTNIERLHYSPSKHPPPPPPPKNPLRMPRMKALQVSNANEEKLPKTSKAKTKMASSIGSNNNSKKGARKDSVTLGEIMNHEILIGNL